MRVTYTVALLSAKHSFYIIFPIGVLWLVQEKRTDAGIIG